MDVGGDGSGTRHCPTEPDWKFNCNSDTGLPVLSLVGNTHLPTMQFNKLFHQRGFPL